MIPANYKGFKVVSWDNTLEEWYKKYEPYFDEALEFTEKYTEREVEPRVIRIYQDTFDISVTSRIDITSYRFRIDEAGKLKYIGYEGDFR